MAEERSVVTRFRVEYNQAVQGLDAIAGSAQKTSREVEKAGTALEQSARKQSDAAGRLRAAEAQLADAKRKNAEGSAQVVTAEEKVARARREVEASTEQATQAQRDYESALKRQQTQQDKTAKSASSAFQDMAKNARDNERAWNQAGTVLAAAGGSIVALGAAATKTGIEYNALQQTSRAAMKTLMGGAKEANAQMDKLDEFARKSPFAKQVFIQAQQQMIGFGIEAKKAIPYLEAIQDAVAATGGSNQQIAEITATMSKIQSASKITAQDLIEFGNRGVDAATLIGSQMGKTGAQIREDITAGSLDATEALDALAAGMSERFGGAAANVKDTFDGAFDRVKAAWRDLSASLAEPLVGPEGGGLAVAGLNKLADALRQFESLPAPIRNTGLALAGLGGAASLAAGGFLLMMPRILETQQAFKALAGQNDLVGKTARGLGKVGTGLRGIAREAAGIAALTGLAVALGKATEGQKLEQLAQDTRSVAKGLKDIRDNSDGLDRIFQLSDGGALTGDVDDLGAALDRTFNRSWDQRFNDWGESILQPLTGLRGSSGVVADGFAAIDTELAALVEGGNATEAAASFAEIKKQAEDQGIGIERLKILFPEYIAAAEEAGTASAAAADGIGAMSPEAAQAQEQLTEYANALREGAMGFLDFAEKAKDSQVSLSEWIDDMAAQIEAQETWFSNLETLMQRGAPQEFIDFLMSLGEEGAFRVKQLADASDTELQRAINKFNEGSSSIDDFVQDVLGIPDIDLDADASKLKEQVKAAKDKLKELQEMPTNPQIDAQITLLEEKIEQAEGKLDELENKKTKPKVDADTDPAKKSVNSFQDWLKSKSMWVSIKTFFEGEADGSNARERRKRAGRDGAGVGGRYHGGIDLMPMARGSVLSSVAQMVPPNTWRIVGDRMDVDEAFIPLDGSKRSWKILAESMRRMPGVMPMARGGITSADERERKREEARREAEQRAREERERRDRVRALQTALRADLRRSSIREQITGGLSGAYSAVDRMFGLGKNDDLSRGARSTASSSARRFEANLRRLYGQAEKLDERLKDAKDKASELEGIQKSVASSVSRNAYSLDTSSQWAQNSAGQWEQTVGVRGARTNAAAAAARVKELAQKLKQLRGMGYGGAILQEVAQANSIDDSLAMANDLLQGSKSDVSSLNASYADIEKYSQQAGQYVTAGFYKGGVNAAQGVVKGIESQKKNVENQIASLAKQMETTFKRVLGIHSPSTVTTEIGVDTARGLPVGMLSQIDSIRSAAAAMAEAATPDLGSMLAPVVSADVAPANSSVEDMSTSTLAGLSEMRQAVSEAFLDMTSTTTESQGVMNESTRVNQEAMTSTTQANHAQMGEVVNVEQAAMLNTVRERQIAMLNETRSQQNSMLETTRSSFASIRSVGTNETNILRSNVVSTMTGMRIDHQAHLSGMQETNRRGFKEMERSGVAAFMGMRSGIDGEMGRARPELRSNLNDLIDVFDRFTKSVNEAFGDVGVKLSSPTRLYTGGVLPGHTPGRDIHHFRSPSAGDLYLSGGEAIMRPEFTRAVGGERGVKELNALARGGRFGDMNSALHTAMYASGGVLPPIRGVNAFADSGVWRSLFGAVKEKFPSVRLHSAYRPGSITATGNRSMHGQGKAIDITPRMDIANWIRENFGGGTRELIFSPMGARQIHRGRNHFYSGITRAQHWDHIHWAMDQMLRGVMPFTGDGTYSGGMPVHPFLDKAGVTPGADLKKAYREAAKKQMATILKKHVGELSGLNPTMSDLGEGIMKSTREGLIKKAEEHAESMRFIMPGGEGVARWRDTVIQALRYAGLPQTEDYISAWLRQIKTESGGNPNIMQRIRDVNSGGNEAAGLVQVIPGTFAAFRDKSLPNDRTHPLANLVAGMNWAKFKAKRRGRSMLSFIGHGHGYSRGTSGAPPGVALIGEEGPELVELGGGERIRTNPETRRFLDIQARPNNTATIDYDQLSRAIAKALPGQDIAAALNGAQMTLNVDGKAMTGFVHTAVASGYSESKSRLSRSSSKVGAR